MDAIGSQTNLTKGNGKKSHEWKEDQFEPLRVLGRGGFAIVSLQRVKATKRLVAVKQVSKGFCIEQDCKEHVVNEMRIMSLLESEFVAPLFGFGQDAQFLYLIMDYISGGDLYGFMVEHPEYFSVETARFHGFCMALALEHLHLRSVAYRDLKPENILVRANGYPVLTDFGFSKFIVGPTFTFCGTADYLAPEVIKGTGYDDAADWWALGILIFEVAELETLFGGSDLAPDVVVQNVLVGLDAALRGRPNVAAAIRQVVHDFCKVNPSDRVGYIGGIDEIARNPFFAALDHEAVVAQTLKAPFEPNVKKADLNLKPEPIELPEDLFVQMDYVNFPHRPEEVMWDLNF
jgi:serine/threonine protein kinase